MLTDLLLNILKSREIIFSLEIVFGFQYFLSFFHTCDHQIFFNVYIIEIYRIELLEGLKGKSKHLNTILERETNIIYIRQFIPSDYNLVCEICVAF